MNQLAPQDYLENFLYDDIRLGQSAHTTRTLTLDDIRAFAAVSGDINPAHVDPTYANATLFHGIIAHGMWGGALISALLGTVFPGPGTIYLEQVLHFSKPVRVGDTLTVTVTVTSKDDEKKRLDMDCQVVNQKGDTVLHGLARVLAPTQKVRIARTAAPHIQLFDPEARLNALLAMGDGLAAIRCGIVHPCDEDSLRSALESARRGLIEPVLIGPENRIRELAQQAGIDVQGIEIVAVAHSHAAAEKAAEMAAAGELESLMKGSLHTDELIRAITATPALRTARRMSHLFRFDVPAYHKPLLLTDAALHIRPGLSDKADIIQNAILFAQVMGIPLPKVAILSAVETINPNIPSTVDAAALCKMAQRRQITGGLVDGPLAFDNAISLHAAHIKGIESDVAGDADILVVPDLESGNMLGKQLEYLAGATASGIVLGARIPIALTSRADGVTARVASALLAKVLAHHNRQVTP
ncbi:bifunctional enoyl-CoA hydratase/phosphate acetyltransferase [Actimicrobium antarcticum]|uniref:Bifunctional enoyl-CoA hydratase/phosphate acetyltransferase n=1 Tax=Actimicrobium antarcticum TaxID=1051899 RepID=A0ABP7STL2_9BURK